MKSRGTVEQAMDWEWATEWVAKRLVATGYHRDRLHAIRLHNGDCREIKVKEGKCKRNNDPYVWRVLELSAQAAREEKIIAEKETKNPL